MRFLFSASLAVILSIVSRTSASYNSTCDASGLSSGNPWTGSRLVDFTNAPWTFDVLDARDMGSMEVGGGLLARQTFECDDPGWVPRCPGPRPCCPPSYTVCCSQTGTCCPGGAVCTSQIGICCPTGGSYCGGTTCCNTAIAQCCKQGSPRCCPKSGSCCGSTCCLSDETCCGDTCCTSSERCENQRCVSTNPVPLPAPPASGGGNEGGDDDGPEVEVETEITIQPSDPGIDYSGSWSDTGGSCNNGTRITFEVESKFTYKFRGNEMVVSFVAKDQEAEVSVELNGVEIEKVTIPARTSSQCQLQDSWRRNFTSTQDQEVSFTFLGVPVTNGKRAPVSLELGQIRYISVSQRPSASSPVPSLGSSIGNDVVGKAAFSIATVVVYTALLALNAGIHVA